MKRHYPLAPRFMGRKPILDNKTVPGWCGNRYSWARSTSIINVFGFFRVGSEPLGADRLLAMAEINPGIGKGFLAHLRNEWLRGTT